MSEINIKCPCDINDTIYCLDANNKTIIKCKVTRIQYTRGFNGYQELLVEISGESFPFKAFRYKTLTIKDYNTLWFTDINQAEKRKSEIGSTNYGE